MALDILLFVVLLSTCFVDTSDAVCNETKLEICALPSEKTSVNDFRGNAEEHCTRWSATVNCIENLHCDKPDESGVFKFYEKNISNFQSYYGYYTALTSSFCTEEGRAVMERNFDCFESVNEYIENKTDTPGGFSVLCSYVPVIPQSWDPDPFSTVDEFCRYVGSVTRCYFDIDKKKCNEELARTYASFNLHMYVNMYGCAIDDSYLHNGSNGAGNGTFSEMSMSQYNAMKSAVIALAVVAFVAITVVVVLIIFMCVNENRRKDKPELANQASAGQCHSVDTDNSTDIDYQQIDKVTTENEPSYETLSGI